jgi:hypothetical protein
VDQDVAAAILLKAGETFLLELHRRGLAEQLVTVLQRALIRALAIGFVILPATKEDANPFERKSSNDCVPWFATRALPLVISLRPNRRRQGMHSPFMKRLAQELRAGPAPMNTRLFAAAGEHGRNAAVALQFTGALITIALRTQRGNESGRQDRAHSG